MLNEIHTRRRFLAWLPGVAGALTFASLSAGPVAPATGWGHEPRRRRGRNEHPDPRPGIDGSKVLRADKLKDHPEAIPAFDKVREIPQIADGIRCHCGCAEVPGFYSLLSCYEGDGMAKHCKVCQGEGELAHELFKKGKKLKEIREAIDKEFG